MKKKNNCCKIPSRVQLKKRESKMDIVLTQMEKIVKDKLTGQKILPPILLGAVISIIAFLFTYNLGNTIESMQLQFYVCAYALLCFALLITSMFREPNYKEIVKETKEKFTPYKLNTYYHLADNEFILALEKYAGEKMNYAQQLRANCIKQKVNEYAAKHRLIKLALLIVLAGTLLLCLVCIWGAINMPTILNSAGGNV